MAQDQHEHSEIMKCLGIIMGRQEESAKVSIRQAEENSKMAQRQTYALIGIIAAQIGVKILGSDPFLDIATALAFLSCTMLLGFLLLGIRKLNGANEGRSLTTTGKWFAISIMLIFLTQIGVYVRDLGVISSRCVYIIRDFQNLSLCIFAWQLMKHAEIFHKQTKECDRSDKCLRSD